MPQAVDEDAERSTNAQDWAVIAANLAVVLQNHTLRDQQDMLREVAETFVALAISPSATGMLMQEREKDQRDSDVKSPKLYTCLLAGNLRPAVNNTLQLCGQQPHSNEGIASRIPAAAY